MSEEMKKKLSKIRIERKLSKGSKNPNYKGGKITLDGYIYIYNYKHPNATKQGYVAEHRLVMEDYLNRYLTKNEVIHHKNGDKQDNRIENLELFESCGRHTTTYHINKDRLGRFSK